MGRRKRHSQTKWLANTGRTFMYHIYTKEKPFKAGDKEPAHIMYYLYMYHGKYFRGFMQEG